MLPKIPRRPRQDPRCMAKSRFQWIGYRRSDYRSGMASWLGVSGRFILFIAPSQHTELSSGAVCIVIASTTVCTGRDGECPDILPISTGGLWRTCGDLLGSLSPQDPAELSGRSRFGYQGRSHKAGGPRWHSSKQMWRGVTRTSA